MNDRCRSIGMINSYLFVLETWFPSGLEKPGQIGRYFPAREKLGNLTEKSGKGGNHDERLDKINYNVKIFDPLLR